MEKKICIDISKETERFEQHIQVPNNNHIIFSGIFGIGKTYFIEKFFEQNIKKYNAIKISPVNYVVSQNEDIMEYIKYDIAFELLAKEIDFEKIDYSIFDTLPFFIKDNFLEVISLLASNASEIGKTISSVIKSLINLKDKYDKFHKASCVDQEKEIIQYLKELSNKKGSIFEENRITLLIEELTNQLKHENKETVLVIDDLDRLDPEHIFRILNVFACHFDHHKSGKLKFGFDKIILVCDIDNLRNIFHNKYGTNVDFTGYIDKFFSIEIFNFDNKESIINCLTDIFQSIKTSGSNSNYYNLADENFYFRHLLNKILESIVNQNLINLRSLLKFTNKEVLLENSELYFENNFSTIFNKHIPIAIIFDFLIKIFGSPSSLETTLKICAETHHKIKVTDGSKNLLEALLPILDHENHNFNNNQYRYINNDLNIEISYELRMIHAQIEYYQGRNIYIKKYDDKNSHEDKTNKEEQELGVFPFHKLLYLTYKKYLNIIKKKR